MSVKEGQTRTGCPSLGVRGLPSGREQVAQAKLRFSASARRMLCGLRARSGCAAGCGETHQPGGDDDGDAWHSGARSRLHQPGVYLLMTIRACSGCAESTAVIRQYRLRQPRCRHAGTDLLGPAAADGAGGRGWQLHPRFLRPQQTFGPTELHAATASRALPSQWFGGAPRLALRSRLLQSASIRPQ
jgi:hypothetical protein